MYKGSRNIKCVNGDAECLAYEALCKRLGFSPEAEFVAITNAGPVTFTTGKPEEIKALHAAVLREGFKPARIVVKISNI